MSHSHLISVDWGTSNLRMALLDLDKMEVGSIHYGNLGIKATDEAFQNSKISRHEFFLGYLLDEISRVNFSSADNTPILISGMASSSIGIRELPYASIPFSCLGTGLIIESIANNFQRQIYLISGVKAESDVMRGEETQLIGLQKDLPHQGKSLIILPGTHSKHVKIHDGNVTDFQTYLTGELFDVISKHTILKNSVETVADASENLHFFRRGVESSASGQFLQSLFKIRAKDLLGKQSKDQNYHYLSGLLLGLELGGLKDINRDIYLAGVHPLSALYQAAANVLEIHFNTVSSSKVQRAVMQGHLQIYNSSILP